MWGKVDIPPHFPHISARLQAKCGGHRRACVVRIAQRFRDFYGFQRVITGRAVVDRARFELAYACAGRFTVCCL